MPTPRSLLAYARSKIFSRHVYYEFPISMLADKTSNLPALKPGYEYRNPSSAQDLIDWAALMNREEGFGVWTAERIRRELMSRLISPEGAAFICFNGKPIASGCIIDASTSHRRIADTMYLYVCPEHRGNKSISYYITYRALKVCVDLGYDQVIGATDPQRLSALLLYLSNGAVPLRNSLYSYVQWHRILKRLSPAMASIQRRRARAQQANVANAAD